MNYVAIDPQGYYFDPETGADLEISWDDYGNPINASNGAQLQFWGDSGFDGGQITQAVRDVLISIYGNPASVRANAPMDRYPGQAQSPSGVRVITSQPPVPRVSSSDGAGIHLSTQTLMLLVGGVLLFMLGQSRGGKR